MYWLEVPLEEGSAGEKAERVSRCVSCGVGAESADGGGFWELKLVMDQRTMHSSTATLENIKSP